MNNSRKMIARTTINSSTFQLSKCVKSRQSLELGFRHTIEERHTHEGRQQGIGYHRVKLHRKLTKPYPAGTAVGLHEKRVQTDAPQTMS